MNQVVLSLYTK